MGPAIPYTKIPEIPLPFGEPLNSIKPFGVLVAFGVYLGSIVAVRHARQRGVDVNKMNSFILYVVGIGFIGGHVFDAIFYTPERIKADPLYLLMIHKGLSSYGGFLGAIIGALIFKAIKKEKVLPLVDTVCSAFPLAWVFGRMGCAAVHDHPGRETSSWLGMQYYHPGVRDPNQWWFLYDSNQTIGRFDLGFIEMALTIPLAVTFAILWNRAPRRFGFYAGWQCVLYAPIRFVLDFFRIEEGTFTGHEADPRLLGLTPAQYACFLLLGLGVFILWLSKRHPAPATWAEVKPWSEEDDAAADDDEDEDEDEEAARKKKRAALAKKKKLAAKKKSASGGDVEETKKSASSADAKKKPLKKKPAVEAKKPEEKPAEEKPDPKKDKTEETQRSAADEDDDDKDEDEDEDEKKKD